MKTIKLFLLAAFLLSMQVLYSYPRFSAYTGDKCSDCHVNPQGGGMRSQYGQHFAKQNLQMDFLKKLVTKKTDFSTQLNKNISIGGDVRIVHVGNENTSGPSTNTFLTMQGDFYANANVNDYISVYVAPGLQIPNIPTKYEVYGMVGNLPASLYFRAGRMMPTFGMKVVEHRAYQRQSLLGTPYAQSDGVEIGLSPGFLNFSAGLYNGLNTNFFDNDPKRMFVSSADFSFTPVEDKFNVNFGASFYNNPYNFLDPVSGNQTDAIKQAYGGFAKFGIFKRVALLGEVDFLEDTQLSSMKRGIFGYAELNVIIVNGVEFRSQYEITRPDRNTENNRTIRTSVGAALFPLTGFETEAMMRFVSDDRQPNTTEFQWSFHFYF
jgi:hypothetical protein